MRLFRHGVRNVIEAPQDELAWEVAARLLSVYGLVNAYEAIDALADQEPVDRWLEFLRKAFLHAHRGLEDDNEPRLSVSTMAGLWIRGSKGHHLQDALRKDELPPAGWLARWLLALRCITTKPMFGTWESLALSLGFETCRDLRRFVRRFSGHAPSHLRTEDLVLLFKTRVRPR